MNLLVSALVVASSFFGLVLPETPKVNAMDLQRLTGSQWTGTLTYLDYPSGKQVSIPANLTVTQAAEDSLSWIFAYQYPDEPKANSKDTVTISQDGKTIDGEAVIERTSLAGDTLRLVAEKSGTDNDKQATFRFTYLLGSNSFSVRKGVRYAGTSEFFQRNQSSWKR